VRAIAFLLLAGCAGRTSTASSTPEAPPPPKPPAEAVVAAPRNPEAERWHDLALGYYNKGDFDKAKECARRAVQLAPEDLAARKLLADIHSIVAGGGPAPTPHEHDVRIHLVRVEQAQIEISKHVRDGQRYLGARMYESALREFETAELKIRALPYDVEPLRKLLPEVRAGIQASKR
jgi:tetratricopeptide (TPR) repeat protein